MIGEHYEDHEGETPPVQRSASGQGQAHRNYVRQAIEQGFADSRAGRTVSVAEVREKYGLQP